MEELTTTKKSLPQRIKADFKANPEKYYQRAGYAGLGLTTAVSMYAGSKLPRAIEKAKKDINEDDKKLKKIWKYTKRIAPLVALPVGTSLLTGKMFKSAYDAQGHKITVLGAYAAGLAAELNQYKKTVEEVGGKKVAEKVKHAIHEEEVKNVESPEDKKKLEEQREANPNSHGYSGMKTPYYDKKLQKIHWNTRDGMVNIKAKLMAELEVNDEVPLSSFYEGLGYGSYDMPPVPDWAYDYGWRADGYSDRARIRDDLARAFFDIDGDTCETHDGIPCMVLEFYDLKPLCIAQAL